MDIALALGGGGVRGFAHLGVIHVLQQTGFVIRAIAGSSAGAVVGALFAAGHDLEKIQYALENIDLSHVFSRKGEDQPSILGLVSFERFLIEMLGSRSFAELDIPLAVNAVNLSTGMLRSFREGNVLNAVMASIAVPGIFPPRLIENELYVDGCVVDPVPVQSARALAPGIPVVAVVLSPSLRNWKEYNKKSSLVGAMPFLERFLDRSRVAQSIDIFLRAVDIGSTLIADRNLERDQPDILLRPAVFDAGLLDKVKGEILVTAGENAAFAQLEAIRRAVSWRGRLERFFRMQPVVR